MSLIITKGKSKTHKFCPRCSKLKPANKFYQNATTYDGLAGYCKKCRQEYRLGNKEKLYLCLHKRPFPSDGQCEICSVELGRQFYGYHHFDDGNPSLGLWVCSSCDYLVEGLDEIGRNPWKVDIYRRLKGEVEEAEKMYVYLGPFLPPEGIRRLYSPDENLTHKWCPHCGKMLPVGEFHKLFISCDGLYHTCKKCTLSFRIICKSGFFFGLHKRTNPGSCEFCDNSNVRLHYHHWDDDNASKGLWVCGRSNKCHDLAEAVDKIDSGSLLPGKYSKLKQEIVLVGVN